MKNFKIIFLVAAVAMLMVPATTFAKGPKFSFSFGFFDCCPFFAPPPPPPVVVEYVPVPPPPPVVYYPCPYQGYAYPTPGYYPQPYPQQQQGYVYYQHCQPAPRHHGCHCHRH